ncbi:MAG TPA: DUF6600 domain-containing protein [Myxococcales bacterium]|nr:DUF6600 domain-containing protein [Myxococcales bacterium]
MSRYDIPLSILVAALAGAVGIAAIPREVRGQVAASDTAPPPPPPEADDESPDAPPPPGALPPSKPLDIDRAEAQLSSFGRWVDTPEYGRVWIPSGVSGDWQPYTDGRWVYTDWGWSFVSDVPWGPIVFHYGRWGFGVGLGWFWAPGIVWAPAWVSWRYSDGFICWAPFGPAGYAYPREWHGWAVVSREHFTHPLRREVLPWAHVHTIVRGARPAPSIQNVPHAGVPYGPPRAHVPRARAGGGRHR